MTIRLHHCHGTRSQRVLWLLHELDLTFEVVVWSFDKSLRSDDFRAVNVVGRVPALEIHGEVMSESLAILEYLCERFPDAGLGRAPGDPDRIDWLQWLHFAETISQHTAALTQQHIALYDDAMRSPIVMQIEARRLARCFKALESRLSTPIESRETLLTSGFSAVDIAVGQAVDMGRHFVRLEGYPELADWFARIAARPAFVKSLPPEGQALYAQDFYPPWEGPRG